MKQNAEYTGMERVCQDKLCIGKASEPVLKWRLFALSNGNVYIPRYLSFGIGIKRNQSTFFCKFGDKGILLFRPIQHIYHQIPWRLRCSRGKTLIILPAEQHCRIQHLTGLDIEQFLAQPDAGFFPD